MNGDLPDGFVDPLVPEQVAAVLAAVREHLGLTGLLDLLTRVPGLTVDPGRSGGLLRAATAPWVSGGDDVVRFAKPVVRERVVGGVVLSRTPVPTATLPATLATLVRETVRRDGAREDVSVALTAARDAVSS
ncbi:MAG: hypothetical protein DLM57_15565 [Pseudonocardiales bacterium]|nr:MAG: hypothetical protein DLM57_15565 [Pseudonocardiales bacterium]